MDYLLHILILSSIYGILAVSLNLVAGRAGLVSVCHASFFAVGAYCVAIPGVGWGWSFLPSLLLGMCLSAVLGLVAGYPSLRLRDDYFVITTFAFQMVVFSVLNNWVGLTKGPFGIPAIPTPELFGFRCDTKGEFFLLSLTSMLCVLYVANRLVASPYGRVLHAVREGDLFALSLGKNVVYYKLSVFAVSAALASVGGAVYAAYISFIDPSSFTLMESVLILSMVILGGLGNLWGSVIGAAFLVVLPEGLRFIGMPSTVAAPVQQIIYGGLLVVVVLFRPQGILPEQRSVLRGATVSTKCSEETET